MRKAPFRELFILHFVFIIYHFAFLKHCAEPRKCEMMNDG